MQTLAHFSLVSLVRITKIKLKGNGFDAKRERERKGERKDAARSKKITRITKNRMSKMSWKGSADERRRNQWAMGEIQK